MAELTQTRDAYGEALVEVGRAHPDVAVLDADLYKSTKTVLFKDAFPDRFIDIGISEMDLVSTGAGMAASGLVTYCNSFAMFITAHCYDQIRIQICYPNLHVILAGSSAGLTQGPDGASHQSLEDVALMRALPNMRVLVPADAVETRSMTRALAKEIDGPAYIRLGRYPVADVMPADYSYQLGRAVTMRPGKEVTLIACGHMVGVAVAAAERLAGRQVDAAVINMSTIKPLDADAVYSAMRSTPLVVTIEEHSIIGGLGTAVAEVMAGDGCGARLIRLGTQDVFGESGDADELLALHGLTSDAIADRVSQEFGR